MNVTIEQLRSELAKHAKTTQPPPQTSVKKDWIRAITAAIAIGAALSAIGFFLFKSDAEATAEKVSADATHTALKVKDGSLDKDIKRIEKTFDKIGSQMQHIIQNQMRQSKRAKPYNGDD